MLPDGSGAVKDVTGRSGRSGRCVLSSYGLVRLDELTKWSYQERAKGSRKNNLAECGLGRI